MATRTALRRIERPPASTLGAIAVLVLAEVTLVVTYLAVSGTEVTALRYLVYPFVWINVVAYAAMRVRPPATDLRLLAIGAGVGLGYFGVLAWLTGMIGLGHGGPIVVRVVDAVPGWGPMVALSGAVSGVIVPFELVGYLGLSYLVGINAIAVSRRVLSGLLGVATCVGCTVPVLVPLVGALGGTSSGLATTAYAWSYDLGTAVFVLTAWLLLRGALTARE